MQNKQIVTKFSPPKSLLDTFSCATVLIMQTIERFEAEKGKAWRGAQAVCESCHGYFVNIKERLYS